jgi:uncharacterized membrane-anchored protein
LRSALGIIGVIVFALGGGFFFYHLGSILHNSVGAASFGNFVGGALCFLILSFGFWIIVLSDKPDRRNL